MNRKQRQALALQELAEFVKTKSERYAKLKSLQHDYLFDNYNQANFAPIASFKVEGTKKTARDEFEATAERGMSSYELVHKIVDNKEIIDGYLWWRHYYEYYNIYVAEVAKFFEQLDGIPAIAEEYTIDKQTYDAEYLQQIERVLLDEERPKKIVEYAITIRYMLVRKLHSDEYLDFTLSGFTLSDTVNQFDVEKPEELKTWLSPAQIAYNQAFDEALAYDAKLNAERELAKTNARNEIDASYLKVVHQFKDVVVDAYKQVVADVEHIDSDVRRKSKLQSYLDGVDKSEALAQTKINGILSSVDAPDLKEFAESRKIQIFSDLKDDIRQINSQIRILFWDTEGEILSAEELKNVL